MDKLTAAVREMEGEPENEMVAALEGVMATEGLGLTPRSSGDSVTPFHSAWEGDV
jgi:hypothetical protein